MLKYVKLWVISSSKVADVNTVVNLQIEMDLESVFLETVERTITTDVKEEPEEDPLAGDKK